jgi:hypothetical protein
MEGKKLTAAQKKAQKQICLPVESYRADQEELKRYREAESKAKKDEKERDEADLKRYREQEAERVKVAAKGRK